MADSWNKKEREKKKQQQKKEKAERKQERKEQSKDSSLDSMMAYIDEYGNITSTPPDPSRRQEVKLEDIEIGVPKQRELDPSELIRTGTVSFFNESKGYGFIVDRETKERIFVHVNQLTEEIKEQDVVNYEVEMGPKGLNALHVKIVR